ncbi:MAG: hypothetical protein HY700_06240 [Gemmatimonadetes bacterium]|nr:hypothetical protein [Gemmatimonadota bacterium]
MSRWILILGSDYENQLVGTKIAYLGFARDASTALNDGYLWISGDGVQSIRSSFNLEFRQQNNVGRNLPQNVDVSKIFTVGPWHHFELALELNTLGSANGKVKWSITA